MENLTAKLKPIDKDSEAIILLHGLARTSRSMNKAAKLLAAYGYKIVNVDYPFAERWHRRLGANMHRSGVETMQVGRH